MDLILEKKLSRNLTEEELTDFEELLSKQYRPSATTDGKATTHKIFLAFCEKRFPKPIEQVIDITKRIFHDQILSYATITPDFLWICHIYPEYEVFKEQTQTALKYILPALTTQQFYRLFKFLRMYYYNCTVVSYLRTAIFKCGTNVDKRPFINALMDIVVNEVLPVMKYSLILCLIEFKLNFVLFF